MRTFWMTMWIGLGAIGCETAADVETGDTDSDAPDIAGDYNVTLIDPTGCAGDASAAAPFAGALHVEGTPSALTFTFDDTVSFGGSVDEAFFFEVGGDAIVGEKSLDFYVSGVATQDVDTWVLEGAFTLEVVDASPECVISGTLQARQSEG